MWLKRVFSIAILIGFAVTGIQAQVSESETLFPIYPETTDFGEFLCKLWFWRGEPPCFKETVWHDSYAIYPTREKAKNIVDTYKIEGLYSQELLVSFFGTLMTGNYRPEPSIPIGNYWDSGYFALVKLDQRIIAKKMLLDIVFDRDWVQGRFQDQRFKALKTLSTERILTIREYQPLHDYLSEELNKENPDMRWLNTLIDALSSYIEWGEDLLPLFRDTIVKAEPGNYQRVLQTFIDFLSRDDSVYILDKIIDGTIEDVQDKKMAIRTAYVLDEEYTVKRLNEYIDTVESDNEKEIEPELMEYIKTSLVRISWYGNWEIIETKDTWDAGLEGEVIAFRMADTLNEDDDTVNFSMEMQISDPVLMKPIGLDDTYQTNRVDWFVNDEILRFTIGYSNSHDTDVKEFIIEEGRGREKGQTYLKFPLEGQTDRRGNPKYGWVKIEKIS